MLTGLAGDSRGAAAIEFALVGSAFIMTLVFVMVGGLLAFLDQTLDRAAAISARQIMVGAVQKANMGQSAFRTTVVCPALPSTMNCSDVIVNVQTITEAAQPAGYYALVNSNQTGLTIPSLSNANAQFSPGTQGNFVYLQIIYPITVLPSFMARLLGGGYSYNGSPAYLMVSTATFRNELY